MRKCGLAPCERLVAIDPLAEAEWEDRVLCSDHAESFRREVLDPCESDEDSVFVALCEIARQWIRDDGQE